MTSFSVAPPPRPVSARFWTPLIRPHQSIQEPEEQRKARLLSIMLIITFLIGIILISALIAASPDELTATDLRAFSVSILTMPVIYVINRLGKTRLAANLFVFAIYAAPAFSSYDISSGISSLVYVSVAYLMAGIFFQLRSFLITTTSGTLLVGLLLFLANGDPTSHVSQSPVAYANSFFFVILMAFLISAFIVNLRSTEAQRRRELEVANAGLRVSEAQLEQRVKDRTAELEKAKEEAEQANLVKSAFLASMSHELRTPLNAIINFTKFVAKGDLGEVNSDQVETLNEVVDSGKHLLNLINDVLDMSKIEAGSLNLFVEDDVSLKSILASVEPIAKTLLADKPITLKIDVSETLPLLRVDRQRIFQVILNIVSNACKFTKEGSIHLQAVQQGDDVLISVTDTGPGIAPEDHALVFEAFKQTDDGLRQGGGTGLGMPISKSLVESHGGRFWLESASGKGATFFVVLPIKSAQLIPMFSTDEHVN